MSDSKLTFVEDSKTLNETFGVSKEKMNDLGQKINKQASDFARRGGGCEDDILRAMAPEVTCAGEAFMLGFMYSEVKSKLTELAKGGNGMKITREEWEKQTGRKWNSSDPLEDLDIQDNNH